MSIAPTPSNAAFYIADGFAPQLAALGLDSPEAVFAFARGENLVKANLAAWRHRIRLRLPDGRYAYLKRYDHPPRRVQLKAWLQHGRRCFLSDFDKGPAEAMRQADVAIPQVIACGGQWRGLFEARSFIITLEIPDAHSLEKQRPACFQPSSSPAARKALIEKTAAFIRRFHATGYRHRDLYLAHLFWSAEQTLYLIDLHRTFKPKRLAERYRLKDIAQLYYSCPGDVISAADRLRFFRAYSQTRRLTPADKTWIRRVRAKAVRMAAHDRKHGRAVPFEHAAAKERRPSC